MKKSINIIQLMLIALAIITMTACDENANKKTLGNSQDTTSVNKAGGPPIPDTATISKNQSDSARVPAKTNTTKGNADPSGRVKNQ